jgi:hypothetical protein
MSEHLIPFRGKRYSGSVNQNLLWRDGNVFLMDNHRAALWCWQQEIDLYETRHSILHIDRHTDCLGANLDAHLAAMPDLRGLSIEDYLNATVALSGGNVPLFRWDNYLSIHLKEFSKQVSVLRSVDHEDGDAPDHPRTIRPGADEVPPNLLYWLRNDPAPWIINVDLDYFFFEVADASSEDMVWFPMFSDAFIDVLFGEIKKAMDEGLIGVVTLCLTPTNFTAGWDKCLGLSARIFNIVGATHPTL